MIVKKCIICNNNNLEEWLDLGKQSLANQYNKYSCINNKYRLKIQFCKNCTHNQLTERPSPEELFGNYLYVSSTSKSLEKYFDWLSSFTINRSIIKDKLSRILDIASNDGTLLKQYINKGYKVLGIDPASNIADIANSQGVETIKCFWNLKEAKKLKEKFSIITAINVLPHVDNPYEFLIAMKSVLRKGGKIYIQTSQCDIFENIGFDNIYHEHLSYFTVTSMKHLVEKCSMYISHFEIVDIHSKSFLFEISPDVKSHCKSIYYHIDKENKLYNIEFYKNFTNKVEKIKKSLLDILEKSDRKIISYGASAKLSTLLNYIDKDLEYIVDDNTLKQGLYTSRNIQIYDPDILKYEKENLLILSGAWNFSNEIIEKIKKRLKNFQYLTYIPEVRIKEFNELT